MSKRNRIQTAYDNFPSRPSVMDHQFSRVPSVQIPRSSFDRSHTHKTTFDSGFLVPIYVDEALPGDTFNLKMNALVRMTTPLTAPIFDNLYLDTFFFFIPNRLIWDNWERFNGAQDDPDDSTDFVIPTFANTGGVQEGTIHDYMGVPVGVTNLEFSALWARSYNLVYNSWFRDENLIDSVTVDKGDTGAGQNSYNLLRRGKRHDYFSSSLPWPQKGDSISIPLGTTADVSISGNGVPSWDATGGGYNGAELGALLGDGGLTRWNNATGSIPSPVESMEWDDPALTGEADLSTATAVTINTLRQGFQTQRMLERDARGGTRYTEIVRSHFGVVSPDARLQRPEFLGGGTTRISTNTVVSTTESFTRRQGSVAAWGTGVVDNHGFTKSFTEHGVILGIVNVRADLTYQQGLNRMFSRQTRFDYYWPSLAHIGEQAVLNKEIYAQGTSADDDVFGYQERFAEYRYKPSIITGKFRSTDPNTLDFWHLSQEFDNLPVLGQTFIEENPPVQRILQVQDQPEFLIDAHFSLRCARPMPLYGVPGLIDHF